MNLRGISYAQCIQPRWLPRPDLEGLGIAHRRIPILSLGSSVYYDTRLILQKLEAQFPSSSLATTTPDEEALRKLLEIWTVDGGIFARAAETLPPEVLQDKRFTKDREAFMGRSFEPEYAKKIRPEALVHIREGFDFLENGILSDGRQWILKTEGPTLADIDAVWPFHWLVGLKLALPKEVFSEETHPKVFQWVRRFDDAVEDAKKKIPLVKTLSGEEAANFITNAEPAKVDGGKDEVDVVDPLGLKQGALVESWPTDTGFLNRDRGRLVRLNRHECVLVNEKGVRIHHPRWNFRIKEVDGIDEAKL